MHFFENTEICRNHDTGRSEVLMMMMKRVAFWRQFAFAVTVYAPARICMLFPQNTELSAHLYIGPTQELG